MSSWEIRSKMALDSSQPVTSSHPQATARAPRGRGGHLLLAGSCPLSPGREHAAYRPRAGFATSRLVGQLMLKIAIGLVANSRGFHTKILISGFNIFLVKEHLAALVQHSNSCPL